MDRKGNLNEDSLLRSKVIMEKLGIVSPSIEKDRPMKDNKDLILLIEGIVEKAVNDILTKKLNQIITAKNEAQVAAALTTKTSKSFYIEGEEIL